LKNPTITGHDKPWEGVVQASKQPMPTAFHAHCLLLYFVQPLFCRGTPNLLFGCLLDCGESYQSNISGLRAGPPPVMSLLAHTQCNPAIGQGGAASDPDCGQQYKERAARRPPVLPATYWLPFISSTCGAP
jgi:hypothetical protein